MLARVELHRGSPDAAHTRLVRVAESITQLDLGLSATMMAEAVVPHMATGRWGAYFRTAQRALELGRQVGGATESIAGLVLAPQRMVTGETAAALELFSQYQSLAWEPALWHTAPEIAAMYAQCQIWLERFDLAEPLLDAMIEFARRTGALRALAYPLAVSAQRHFRRGRGRVALQEAAESVSLARELPGGTLLGTNLAYLSLIEAGLGQAELARSHADEALALCQALSLGATAPWALDALALLALSEGDYEGAIRHVRSVDPDVAAGENDPGVRYRNAILIEAYARARDHESARSELARLEYWSNRTGRSLGHARVARCRGLMGPDETIEKHFEHALKWHQDADLPFERAWTQLCYGERLRRAQRRTAARGQLANAVDTFRALGAEIWLGRAEAELSAAGARLPRIEQAAAWEELTTQERRVAQLIIDGATYQEAANELFLRAHDVISDV